MFNIYIYIYIFFLNHLYFIKISELNNKNLSGTISDSIEKLTDLTIL